MLFAFDPRRSYLNGYYPANFAVPNNGGVGPRLGCHKQVGRLGFDSRRRYLSGMGDEPTMFDPGNTLIEPVYTAPNPPLILVPSSAGDPSTYNPTFPLISPTGSSGSNAAGVASAVASAAAAALAARNQAAIVNPALLHASTLSQQVGPYIPYLAVGLVGLMILNSGKKRR